MSIWENYHDVIAQLEDAGFRNVPKGLAGCVPGRKYKFQFDGGDASDRKNRAWFGAREFTKRNGERILCGSFGWSFASTHHVHQIKIDSYVKLTPEEKKAFAEQRRQQEKLAQIARDKVIKEASRHAAYYWKNSPTEGVSPYLNEKNVKNFGCRFNPNGNLVIPITDINGKIYGIQLIGPAVRKKYKTRNKTFCPEGIGKVGHFHMHGIPHGVILISEGYATFASGLDATGLCSVMAIDANNLDPVCRALRKRYPHEKLLILADDDYIQKCVECGDKTTVETSDCQHCGKPHRQINAGLAKAQEISISLSYCEFLTPKFSDDRKGEKITDFNDLHMLEGLNRVRAQIEDKLRALGWVQKPAPVRATINRGAGKRPKYLKSLIPVDEAAERYVQITGVDKTLFDRELCRLVPKGCLLDLMSGRWEDYKNHPRKITTAIDNVGFDPSEKDEDIVCNLWDGWPIEPKSGSCECLLELLGYLCAGEENGNTTIYEWVLKWLAYPLQNAGAKMSTALIFHGPQGVGKNTFFEAIMKIYGKYGRIVDQSAIEDKYNDWVSAKLFLIANEVVARQELFHVKNKLKGLITDDWVRVNPKHVAAHDEKNHANLVFLSNEVQPLVLDRDDRRFLVVWTPPQLSQNIYNAVHDEIANGGVEALYHYLLHLPLGDFAPWTKPPMTASKQDLIEISRDSIEWFIGDWLSGLIYNVPIVPCRTEQLCELFKEWCRIKGIIKFIPSDQIFSIKVNKMPGFKKKPSRFGVGGQTQTVAFFFPPGGKERPIHATETLWLHSCVQEFEQGIQRWRQSLDDHTIVPLAV